MDLGLSEEQKMLQTSAREFLAKECPKKLVREMETDGRGYSPELWRKMADIGWLGIVLPREYGNGGSYLDLVILLQEFGRACVPGPFFSTVVLGAMTLVDVGSESQKQNILPKVARGESILTLALFEPGAGYDPTRIATKSVLEKDHYVINGTKLFVPDASVADWIICVARTSDKGNPEERVTLLLVDAHSPGLSYTMLKTIASDKQCEVVFDKVKVPQENILGDLNKGWVEVEKILQRAQIAKCAEMVGEIEQVRDMAVSYSKERVQFGYPIGSFQAIQMWCTDLAMDALTSKLITYEAACKLSEGLPCAKEIAMAKAWTSEACRRGVLLGHKIHGGYGTDLEHDLQLYFRRITAAAFTYGDANSCWEMIANELKL